jgi:hypothetical protein
MWVFVRNITGQGLQITQWDGLQTWMNRVGFSLGDYHFDMRPILETLVFVAMVFTVAREQYLERKRQARMEIKVRSAREVQQVLVPVSYTALRGYRYWPRKGSLQSR